MTAPKGTREELKLHWVSPPYAGHLFHLVMAAKELQGMGFTEQRFHSTPSAGPLIRSQGLEFRELLGDREDHILAIANTEARVGGSPLALLRQFKETVRVLGEAGDALAKSFGPRGGPDAPDVVIVDRVLPTAGLSAEACGAQWWTSMTSLCPTETRSGTPAYLGGWDHGPGLRRRVRNAAGRALVRGFKRSAAWLARRELGEIGLRRLYRPDGTETLYSGTKILAFGLEEFEFPRADWPGCMDFVGPIVGSPLGQDQAPKLQPGRRHALFTIGTHLLWGKERAFHAARAVARELPAWTIDFTFGDTSGQGRPDLAAQAPANLRVHPFINYGPNLRDYDAVVHHGGSGIVYSALAQGLPAVTWPHDYDQHDHAARIVHHGLGVRTGGNPREIARGLMELVEDAGFRTRCEAFAGLIDGTDPVGSLARSLDALLAEQPQN